MMVLRLQNLKNSWKDILSAKEWATKTFFRRGRFCSKEGSRDVDSASWRGLVGEFMRGNVFASIFFLALN